MRGVERALEAGEAVEHAAAEEVGDGARVQGAGDHGPVDGRVRSGERGVEVGGVRVEAAGGGVEEDGLQVEQGAQGDVGVRGGAAIERAAADGDEVVDLRGEARDVGDARQRRARPAHEERGVPRLRRGGLPALGEPLLREHAHALEEPVAPRRRPWTPRGGSVHGRRRVRLARRIEGTHERLLVQRLEHVDHRRRAGPGVDHREGGLEREAAAEDRALGERLLLPGLEQVPRPGHGRAQRRVPGGGVAGAGDEQVEAAGEEREDLGRSEDAGASGAELDGEGEALERADDGGDDGGVCVGEAEVGSDRAAPGDEELHRLRRGDGRGRVPGGGDVERLDGEAALLPQTEALARGGDDLRVGGEREPGREQPGRQVRELLQVVEDDDGAVQIRERAADLGDGIVHRSRRGERRPEGAGQRRAGVVGGRGGGEIAEQEAGAGPEQGALGGARPLDGETRLADASDADERDEPRALGDEPPEGLRLRRAPDEAQSFPRKDQRRRPRLHAREATRSPPSREDRGSRPARRPWPSAVAPELDHVTQLGAVDARRPEPLRVGEAALERGVFDVRARGVDAP